MFLAHIQAVLIPIFLGIKSRKKFKQIKSQNLSPYALISIGLASMFEMIDHTTTNWIYVDHSSIFNWLFYSFLSCGLSFFTISVSKNKLMIATNIFLIITSIFSYWVFGKSTCLLFQVFISILLISQWWDRFKDWIFMIYPITGVFFTTFFGILLSNTSEQLWHLAIGPSGTISVLTFYTVLKRSNKRETFST